MTEPLTSPEMLIMQERLRALAVDTFAAAEEVEHAGVVDEAEYTAGMMRLQARQLLAQADELEDDDDIQKLDLFISRQELEIKRLWKKMDEAGQAKHKATRYTRREVFWRWVFLAAVGILLVNLGFQLGRLVSGL